MGPYANGRIKLPKQLLSQLDLNVTPPKHGGIVRNGPGARKAQRKAARVEKKDTHTRPRKEARQQLYIAQVPLQERSASIPETSESVLEETQTRSDEDSDATSDAEDIFSEEDVAIDPHAQEAEERRVRKLQKRLASDDAEILALEKKLGIKNKKRLPKSFADDGLLDILDGIDDDTRQENADARVSDEGQQWLARKRRKVHEQKDSESEFAGLDEPDNEIKPAAPFPKQVTRQTQNIYRPPIDYEITVLPAASAKDTNVEDEVLQRLRKIVRGLVNRLSEANLLSLLSDVERLYHDNPRQLASSVLLDAVLDQVGSHDQLTEAFLILYAGFTAAISKVIGYDFGAEAVERITKDLEQSIQAIGSSPQSEKKAVNLLSILSHLFNLRVISSELVYDFVRMFVMDVSEINTQLLLRIIKSSGFQLRQEDPLSLKEIVLQLQSAVARVPPQELSVRTKFMMETITDLKNNKMKAGANAANLAAEHLQRVKKTIGSIAQQRVKASEPLRVSLSDIHDQTKTGQWWMAGAKHRKAEDRQRHVASSDAHSDHVDEELGGNEDIQELALEQRMNTDIRRLVFVNIMSASDYRDAYHRLLGLHLKKSQEPEVPKVLLHCATAEESYNPFYALVANQLCSTKRMRFAFQVALWDMLKRVESDEDTEDLDDTRSGGSQLKMAIYLAKMFGSLVANRRLELKMIKNIDLESLDTRTHAFLEVLLLTICLQAHHHKKKLGLEKGLGDIFHPLCDDPERAHSVQSFLKYTVRKSDMVSNTRDRERLRECCDIAEKILRDEQELVEE